MNATSHHFTAADLARAMEKRELTVVYQPKMTGDGARMVGVEALVRWRHPELGVIGPIDFVDLAQREGLIDDLGCYVLEKACRDGKAWPELTVAVNISPTHFVTPSFIDDIVRTLAATGFEGARLEIEIVESAGFDNPGLAKAQMDRLHELGVSVAMDDFGTGYSSLSMLQSLPFDTIKIDKSFIGGIPKTRSVAILQAIIVLVRAIGMKVVAEGVETEEQHRFLKASGCHYLQGYLFSRPVAPAEITALLERQQPTAPPQTASA